MIYEKTVSERAKKNFKAQNRGGQGRNRTADTSLFRALLREPGYVALDKSRLLNFNANKNRPECVESVPRNLLS